MKKKVKLIGITLYCVVSILIFLGALSYSLDNMVVSPCLLITPFMVHSLACVRFNEKDIFKLFKIID
jgi:hypothetical protein